MLSCSQGRDRLLGLLGLLVFLLLALPSAAVAETHAAGGVADQTASFTVDDPPSSPFHAHQSLILFAPGAKAELHGHG
jgi:hypothetical protein